MKPTRPPLPPLLPLAAALLLVLASLPAAAAQPPPPPSSSSPENPAYPSPAAAVAARPDLSLLVEAVKATGLTAQLSSPDLPATIFAPTNAAMAEAARALDVTPAQILSSNRTLLFDVLRFHVVPGAPVWSLERLRQEKPRLMTLLPGAEPLEISTMANGSVLVGGGLGPTAMVLQGDVYAGKSVLHVIDVVKLPGTLVDLLVPPPAPAPAPPADGAAPAPAP